MQERSRTDAAILNEVGAIRQHGSAMKAREAWLAEMSGEEFAGQRAAGAVIHFGTEAAQTVDVAPTEMPDGSMEQRL